MPLGKSDCDEFFFFQAEDGIRDLIVTGVQTCALPISRPMLALPRCFAEVAGLPLTDANGSDVVGDEVSSTRYDRPACTGMLNVALVCEPTTVAPVPPSTTVTAWPGHGVRIEMGLLVPETIATVDGVPLLTCTSTLVLCWM